jgi:hypothetical protein
MRQISYRSQTQIQLLYELRVVYGHFSLCSIIAEHNVKSSISISPCHDHELTPSTAYAKHSIHQVEHQPKIIFLPFGLMITT